MQGLLGFELPDKEVVLPNDRVRWMEKHTLSFVAEARSTLIVSHGDMQVWPSHHVDFRGIETEGDAGNGGLR